MIAVLDILVYVGFAFFTSFLARRSETFVDEIGESPKCWDRYLICFMAFFAIIGGLRWNVGSDCLSYTFWFKYPRSEELVRDALWRYFLEGVRALHIHWSIALGICAFIQIFFITKALQQYRWLLVFVPFLFFGGRYWMDCMGAVRQMIVACGFLWASKFIVERKLIKYIVCILIASMIHQSAIILLPFYFLPLNISIENHRWKLIIILFACILIGQTPQFSGLVDYVEFISEATNYEDYTGRLTEMLQAEETDEALKIGPMMLSYMAIPIFIILYGPVLKTYFEDIIPSFNLWYNLAYFYACGYFLVCNISHLFIRPMLYFSLFQMVMASLLLALLWTQYREYRVRRYTVWLYCLVIFTNTAWDVYKASGLAWETVTYKLFFMYPEQIILWKL